VELAKQQIDIGLYTNQRQEQLDFWQNTVGLEFDHLGKLGGGVHQLRHHCNGSIIKVNHARDTLADDAPTGLAGLIIARDDIGERRDLTDPDSNAISLVPRGQDNIINLALRLRVRNRAAAQAFYCGALGFDDGGDGRLRCGESFVFLEEDATAPAVSALPGKGLRYFTLQILDCDRTHAQVLAAGGREGRAPITLGDTVRYSFVRDPDGNWIELSERATLTGGLIQRGGA
jgi:lactoylglutathione lyase